MILLTPELWGLWLIIHANITVKSGDFLCVMTIISAMINVFVFNSPLALQDIHNLLFDKQNQNQSHTIDSL